jgi:hypothetical protein
MHARLDAACASHPDEGGCLLAVHIIGRDCRTLRGFRGGYGLHTSAWPVGLAAMISSCILLAAGRGM